MALMEVYGGQRSLAFGLTTAIYYEWECIKCTLGTMATMDDYIKLLLYVKQSLYSYL